ncbi:hypothetical protein, partial [Caldovatus aquaticus]
MPAAAESRRYRAPSGLLRDLPHLPAFFPEAAILPAPWWAVFRRAADPALPLLLPASARRPLRRGGEGASGTAAGGEGGGIRAAPLVLLDAGLWQAPRFGRRRAPVALLAAPSRDAAADPLALVLAHGLGPQAGPLPSGARAAAAEAMALLAEARIGGATGLPDPGPQAGLGCGPGEAVLVVDPCRP